jgi:CHAD domain-containing protein
LHVLVAFALKPGKSIRRQLNRVLRKELGRASRCLLADQKGSEAVHEARKSTKKAEAIVSLFDRLGFAVPRKDARRLRDARHALSILRDAEVLIEIFDGLLTQSPARIPEHTAAMIREHLSRARATSEARARSAGRLVQVATALRKTRRSARGWAAPSVHADALPPVMTCAYRASRKAMIRARNRRRMGDFHEWRKRVKMLWYQLRLAEPLMPGTGATVRRLKQLETTLGEEHNLAVLELRLSRAAPLRRLGAKAAAPRAVAAARQKQLRREALAQGKGLLADPPRRFEKILRRRLKRKDSGRNEATSRRSRAA